MNEGKIYKTLGWTKFYDVWGRPSILETLYPELTTLAKNGLITKKKFRGLPQYQITPQGTKLFNEIAHNNSYLPDKVLRTILNQLPKIRQDFIAQEKAKARLIQLPGQPPEGLQSWKWTWLYHLLTWAPSLATPLASEDISIEEDQAPDDDGGPEELLIIAYGDLPTKQTLHGDTLALLDPWYDKSAPLCKGLITALKESRKETLQAFKKQPIKAFAYNGPQSI